MRDHALRMGKRMAFESPDGATHANSFWCLSRIDIDIEDSALRLNFVGYHDAAAYDAGKLPVAGAAKAYLITGADFAAAASMPSAAANISAEILRLAWVGALAAHDVTSEAGMVSFFFGAVDAE